MQAAVLVLARLSSVVSALQFSKPLNSGRQQSRLVTRAAKASMGIDRSRAACRGKARHEGNGKEKDNHAAKDQRIARALGHPLRGDAVEDQAQEHACQKRPWALVDGSRSSASSPTCFLRTPGG